MDSMPSRKRTRNDVSNSENDEDSIASTSSSEDEIEDQLNSEDESTPSTYCLKPVTMKVMSSWHTSIKYGLLVD